jgi:hypothetical protein
MLRNVDGFDPVGVPPPGGGVVPPSTNGRTAWIRLDDADSTPSTVAVTQYS